MLPVKYVPRVQPQSPGLPCKPAMKNEFAAFIAASTSAGVGLLSAGAAAAAAATTVSVSARGTIVCEGGLFVGGWVVLRC